MSRRRRRLQPATLRRLVLDSGGVSALTGRSGRAREWLRRALEHDGDVVVPAAVLVEATTGTARDAETNRVLVALGPDAVAPAEEAVARSAGHLRCRARTDDCIDALVAAEAARTIPTLVLTSDPDDLRKLIEGSGVHITRV